MLAPTMSVIIFLFIGGLIYGGLVSLGWQPLIGRTEISLRAYQNILFSGEFTEVFWHGLVLTIWVSVGSTVISAVLALMTALLLRRTFVGKRVATFLLPTESCPCRMWWRPSAFYSCSRRAACSPARARNWGLLSYPSDFPVLVKDRYGIGMMLSFVWKEVPFIGVIVLAVLQSLGVDYEDLARSLGANRWQRFRYVILAAGYAGCAVRVDPGLRLHLRLLRGARDSGCALSPHLDGDGGALLPQPGPQRPHRRHGHQHHHFDHRILPGAGLYVAQPPRDSCRIERYDRRRWPKLDQARESGCLRALHYGAVILLIFLLLDALARVSFFNAFSFRWFYPQLFPNELSMRAWESTFAANSKVPEALLTSTILGGRRHP